MQCTYNVTPLRFCSFVGGGWAVMMGDHQRRKKKMDSIRCAYFRGFWPGAILLGIMSSGEKFATLEIPKPAISPTAQTCTRRKHIATTWSQNCCQNPRFVVGGLQDCHPHFPHFVTHCTYGMTICSVGGSCLVYYLIPRTPAKPNKKKRCAWLLSFARFCK